MLRSSSESTLVWIVTAIALMATPTAVASQQSHRFAWWRSEAVVSELGLTSEQTEGIETIFQSMRSEARQELEELERLEAKLSRMVRTDTEEAVVVRQIDRVETARAALSKTRSLMLLRIRKVLTPAQRTALTEIENRREEDRARPAESPRR